MDKKRMNEAIDRMERLIWSLQVGGAKKIMLLDGIKELRKANKEEGKEE